MVFRTKSPQQVIEEVGIFRKRSKGILILLIIVVVVMGYYMMTSHKENKLLGAKNDRLKVRLNRYQSGFEKCEKSLRTSRGDVTNFHEANKSLQKKIKKQLKELAQLEKQHSETEMKLQDAFNFFLEVRRLLGNHDEIVDDHKVTEALSTPLKKDIEALKMSHQAHTKLKEEHKGLRERFKTAKDSLMEVEAEKGETEQQLSTLMNEAKSVRNELNLKESELQKLNQSNSELHDTVGKLKKLIKKVKLDAKKAKLQNQPQKISKDSEVGKANVVVTAAKPSRIAANNRFNVKRPVKLLNYNATDVGPVKLSPRFHGVLREENSLERRIVEHHDNNNNDDNNKDNNNNDNNINNIKNNNDDRNSGLTEQRKDA